MKIIRKGKIPKSVIVLLSKCVVCKTTYEFTEFEGTWIDDENGRVTCPFCGYINRIEVDNGKIPTRDYRRQ